MQELIEGFFFQVKQFFRDLYHAFASDYSDKIEESFPLHERNAIAILHGAIAHLHKEEQRMIFLFGDFAVQFDEYSSNGVAILILEAKLAELIWQELGLLPNNRPFAVTGEIRAKKAKNSPDDIEHGESL